MCIRTISHWQPCLHQRCTSIEISDEAKSTPGLSPFDCTAEGPVFEDDATAEQCPVCARDDAVEQQDQDRIENKAEKLPSPDEGTEDFTSIPVPPNDRES